MWKVWCNELWIIIKYFKITSIISFQIIDVKDVIDVKDYFPKFMRCMKRKILRALDRSLSTDVVPIFDGMNLVRYEMVDRSGNVMNNENDTAR